MGQRATEYQARDDEQQTTDGEAIARTNKDIHTSAQATGHQIRDGTAEGIQNNHAIAQEGELSAISPTKVQGQDAAKTYATAQNFSRSKLIALETGTGQQHHKEGTQRIEDGGSRTFAMRHADIEKEIVERGVHERKGQNETPVGHTAGAERAAVAVGQRQHNGSGGGKTDAGKEHLATSHIGSDAKGREAHLNKREGPTPSNGCSKGKHYHPNGLLENRRHNRLQKYY